ncbi:HAD family hydrolase [Streptomyces sp. A012304]|uniref:HAD-IIIC family phosphatase n=1 Tax=Streptomyces sp. A012304 TaxID=375446 RepID=UPI002230EEF8|nr:HAD-IIIC family phosphatase [Streptomyces sp. A012304]
MTEGETVTDLGAVSEPAGRHRPSLVKCLVWDLDNTLWQGTLMEGDDVVLTDAVREVVHTLDARGVLQAVASKNDHDTAWQRLEKLGIAEYFVLPHIGWGPKSRAVRAIAERLNFAHGAIGFIDDQPAERAEVAHHLPDVRLYAAELAVSLPRRAEFTPAALTVDSGRRRQMYQAGFLRDSARSDFEGPDEEFLRSLRMRMRIARATAEDLTRVEELTLRTSQMNATGVHYDDAALRALMSDPRHEVLVTHLSDRFGPHGAVGVLLLEKHPSVWHLKLLATSCRVVSFGAGKVVLRWLIDQAARAGVHLVADFRPTDRNRIMEIAYRFEGFTDRACGCGRELPAVTDEGVRRWHLEPSRQEAPTTMALDTPALTP